MKNRNHLLYVLLIILGLFFLFKFSSSVYAANRCTKSITSYNADKCNKVTGKCDDITKYITASCKVATDEAEESCNDYSNRCAACLTTNPGLGYQESHCLFDNTGECKTVYDRLWYGTKSGASDYDCIGQTGPNYAVCACVPSDNPPPDCKPDNTCDNAGKLGGDCGGTVPNDCGDYKPNCGQCDFNNTCISDKCVERYGCSNGSCVKKDGGKYAGSNCSGECSGPIAGEVNKPGGAAYSSGVQVVRKANSSSNWDERNNYLTGGNGKYSFGNLATGSIHDIRLARIGDELDFNNLNKINPCLYEPNSADSTPWVKENVQVANSNVDFNLHDQTYTISGRLFWDPKGDGSSTTPYVNKGNIPGKRVTVRIAGEGNDLTDPDTAKYSIKGLKTDSDGKTYKVSVDTSGTDGIRPTHKVEGGNTQDVEINCSDRTQNFYITTITSSYEISGTVYLDDGDNKLEPGTGPGKDKQYKNSQVTIAVENTTRTGKTDRGNGDYTIAENPAGTYTVKIASGLARGYEIVPGEGSRSVTVGPDKTDVNFLVRAVNPSDLITGQIFYDESGDGKFNGQDYYLTNWSGQKITLTPGSTITGPDADATDGSYTFDNLTGANYKVSINNPPGVGYKRTYPVSDDTYTISNLGNGTTCSVLPSGTGADCTATGSVTNVDFGITQVAVVNSWFQGVGGDMNDDNKSSVTIPSDQCFSIAENKLLSPGVIFNFIVSGCKSLTNWYISYPLKNKSIKTSYGYVSAALKKGKATQVNLFGSGAPCGNGADTNCNFNKGGGYYFTTAKSLTLKQANFANDSDYVFLIDGDLNVNGELNVPQGSTVMFVAKGNITVDKNVNHIEGIFSADGNFLVDGKNPNGDKQLVVEGSIIANADKPGGNKFDNQRDLGDLNKTTPSVKIIFRPDFVLNAPDLIRYSNYNFHEAPPSGQ